MILLVAACGGGSSGGKGSGAGNKTPSHTPTSTPTPTPIPTPTPVPLSGWSVVNNTGTTSNWQLVNQAYTQQNFVGGGGSTLNQTYRLGTYMYLNSGSSLTDYTVTLNITPLLPTGGGDPGDDVGVMFRYQNDQNYYRLSFNWPMGFTRLEKQVNGVFSTLAHNGRGAIVGQKQSITIEVISNKILVYQNGQPLFSASDSSLSSGTIALYCRNSTSFDSVSINTNSTAPSIIISTPVSYSVETSNNLNVSAIATNVPTGGGVQFVLDSGTAGQKSFLVSSEPYSGQFTGVSQGEHTVSALILDTNGNILASDTNVRVGVLGNYYVTVGDSITYGLYDNYSLDNSSQDGRIIAEIGYESVLNDLLTSALSFPNIVFNEGVAGDQSINALNRVGSIIERHPKANKALILLGTNDSGGSMPVPSGLGCAGSSCNGTYYQNMQTLVNTLNSNGKAPTVALIPPVNPATSSQNSIIQQYNQVIQNQLTGIKVGPDLYSFYINQLDLYFDAYHPDGLGHPISANLWSNSLLNQSGSPFVLGNLSPSYYKQNLIQSGGDAYGTKSQYYIDATYSLTSIPSELQGSGKVWIMAANGDSNNTSNSFLTFNLPQASTVYVGYDPRATSLPNWLANNFVNTGLTLGVTGGPVATLNLYKASFAAGSVSLGGNMAAGAAFPSGVSGSMYVVIVKP